MNKELIFSGQLLFLFKENDCYIVKWLSGRSCYKEDRVKKDELLKVLTEEFDRKRETFEHFKKNSIALQKQNRTFDDSELYEIKNLLNL